MKVDFELVTNDRGVITQTSSGAAAVLAIDERWLLRKPLASFVAQQDRPRFRMFLIELERGQGAADSHPVTLESRAGGEVASRARVERVDGRVVWRFEADAPFPLEEASQPAEEQDRPHLFERLLARLPVGVVVVDRALRIVYANPSARRIVQARLRIGDPLPDRFKDLSLRDLATSLYTRRPLAGRRLVSAEEKTIAVEGLIAANMPTATLILEDVTEREKARRSERRFVENAAHELRTPLAAIMSVVDVLEAGAKDDPATRDSFLAHIRTHAERLTRLATSLLVLARIQTGQEHPQLDLVRVGPLLEDVGKQVIPNKGVGVSVDAPPDLAVLADRDLLGHALENIGANAAKHTRAGTITLQARDVGRTAEIDITDTGPGMTREEAAQAFDRFYRAHAYDDGFGLGLAIADEAIRALGGTIQIDSAPNAGTRVRVRLPSARVVT